MLHIALYGKIRALRHVTPESSSVPARGLGKHKENVMDFLMRRKLGKSSIGAHGRSFGVCHKEMDNSAFISSLWRISILRNSVRQTPGRSREAGFAEPGISIAGHETACAERTSYV
jgi:hypothetical protein